MIAIRLDQAEWDLLAGEPAELLKLYCALKRRMDFATGIAGHKTLLSEIVLREGFTVDPIPGRPKPKPITREMYRSAMRRLEKLGLLVTIGTMVYQFPHARSDASPKTATTELQPAAQPEQQPTGDRLQPSEHAASSEIEGEQQPKQQPYSPPINNLLPESGNLPTSRHHAREIADRFPMHDDWKPTPSGWKATALRNGLGATPFTSELLMEFRSYWINRPDKYQSQGQWEHELAQKLKREVRNAQRPGFTKAGGRGDQQRPRSAPDRVRDAIDRDRAERAKACGTAADGTDGKAVGDHGGDLRPPLDVEFWREPQA
ncbi:DnaT-like ssDNA-binding domain-containing protein [Ectopseudomonas khazarica]|uniref:DnaT-like ssDNA-binding domain-containing protein n=1 Tax=Ectopseudomonas khazarica TaxID=2502979 RepID=UPI003B92C317